MNRRIIYNDDSQGVRETNPGTVAEDLRAGVARPLTRIPVDTYAWCIFVPIYKSAQLAPRNYPYPYMEELVISVLSSAESTVGRPCQRRRSRQRRAAILRAPAWGSAEHSGRYPGVRTLRRR